MKLTRRGKIVLALTLLIVLLGVPAIAGYIYLNSIGVLGRSDPGKKVEIEISEGASVQEIGRLLESEGVIESSFGLRIAAYLEGGAEDIQAGTYEIRTGLTARDALDALLEGPIVEFVTVTFPEGFWLTDFARVIDRDTHISGEDFLELARTSGVDSALVPKGVDTLEGLLFPATYQVIEKDTAETLLQRLVGEMEKKTEEVGLSQGGPMGLSPYEVVIVASMIEGEALVPEERKKIAAVIYNRLKVGEPLGIDATINYAIGDHRLELTLSELQIDSPYNTRIHAGLPPTPIGAPGVESLRAALEPAVGDWFFYVLKDCEGHHAFSETASEFAQDKAAYEALDCS